MMLEKRLDHAMPFKSDEYKAEAMWMKRLLIDMNNMLLENKSDAEKVAQAKILVKQALTGVDKED